MLKFLQKNYLIILILILASFLRLFRIYDYAEFLGDQGRDLIIIRDFLVNKNLFFIGPQTSVGNMYLGPFFYYLIAPSLLIANFNPVGPAIFIALLGIATVWLVYYTTKLIFKDSPSAYAAAFLYSLSPMVIKYSTFSWNPNIMPFFSLLFILFLYKAFFDKKYFYLSLASLSFVMCFNSHFLALLLLPFAGLLFLKEFIELKISKNNQALKSLFIHLLFAVLIFLISLTPLVLFDYKHQGQNINAFIDFFKYRETTVNLKFYKSIFQFIPVSVNVFSDFFSLSPGVSVFTFSFLFLASLFLFFIKPNKNKLQLIFFLTWFLIGLFGLGLYKQHLYAHYFGFIYPAPFIIIAVVFRQILKNKYLLILPVAIISIPFLLNLHLLKAPASQISHAINLAQAINSNYKNSDKNYNLILLAAYNDFQAQAPRYFLMADTNASKLLSKEEYPQANTMYLILDDPTRWPNPLMTDIWELNSFSPFFVQGTFTSSDSTTIYKLIK